MKPPRGHEPLRRHRITIPNASYFITLCTRDRAIGLTEAPVAMAIQCELTQLDADASATMRAWTIMPDHLHIFFSATGRLSVGQVLGRFKTRLSLLEKALQWQRNFYEHRLRSDDRTEDVLRYIFLNPYRKKLLPLADAYPHFWLCAEEAEWFQPNLDDNRPFPEWLAP